MQFEWDKEKAASNLTKHDVSFEEDCTVFGDFFAKMFYDDEHSTDEKREIIVGYSGRIRLLAVCFTERASKRIRIMNARETTNLERQDYENEQ